MRKAHYLRRTIGNQIPSQIICYDTETTSLEPVDNERVQVLEFGWVCYVRRYQTTKWSEPEWLRFSNHGEFWRFVISKSRDNTRLYLYAHNQSFDFPVLKGFKYLKKRGWKLKLSIIEGPPNCLIFISGRRTIVILDTLNYFRMSLEELGKDIGLPKLIMPETWHNTEEADIYCKRDVEICLKAMLNFIQLVKEWDLGNYSITIPSQAFNCYKHRFMTAPIFIDVNEKALKLSRSAYNGGRTECFKIGTINEPMYLLDINSQYPFVMRSNEYPVECQTYIKDVSLRELNDLLSEYMVTAHVAINTNIPIYPIRHAGKLIFPIGKYETYLSSPELTHALAYNHIEKVYACAVYKKAHIFQDFVDYFYKKRLEYKRKDNEVMSLFCKLLLNSFYGKFGQNGRKYERIGTTPDDKIIVWNEYDVETGVTHKMRQYANVVECQAELAESLESHPAIAAHVTANARMLLWEFICIAGRENVYYTDTDSLLVNVEGYANLISLLSDTKLGCLKLEKTITSATIYGPKDYVFGDIVKRKGISPKAIEIAPGVFEQDQFPSFKGLLRRGDLDTYFIRRITKHLTRQYQKGMVTVWGDVLPHIFNQ